MPSPPAPVAPSTVTIEELKAPDFTPNRVVVLQGASLPFRGATWATEQRMKTKWYSGNAVSATQHVLGPMEIPSEWEGFWRTTRMVASPALYTPQGGSPVKISQADTLRDILDAIFYVGPLLRVTWAQGADRKLVRVGRAKTWTFPHDRMDDIGWKISFEWTGRGSTTQRVVTFRVDSPQPGMDEAVKALNQVVSDLTLTTISSAKPSVPGGALPGIGLADLAALAAAPGAMMAQFGQVANSIANRIGKVGDLISSVENMPASLSAQVEAIGSNMEAACNQFSDEISRVPPDSYATSGTSKVSQVGKLAVYIGKAQASSAAAAAAAASLAERAKMRRNSLSASSSSKSKAGASDVKAIVLVRQGDTFASIARRHYGSAEKGPLIAVANGFSGYQIAPDPGTTLFLPTKANLADLRAS